MLRSRSRTVTDYVQTQPHYHKSVSQKHTQNKARAQQRTAREEGPLISVCEPRRKCWDAENGLASCTTACRTVADRVTIGVTVTVTACVKPASEPSFCLGLSCVGFGQGLSFFRVWCENMCKDRDLVNLHS
jgi:hypothetical protein